MECAQNSLAIEPVISAKEIADPEVDHLGVMAYAAWFQNKGVSHWYEEALLS